MVPSALFDAAVYQICPSRSEVAGCCTPFCRLWDARTFERQTPSPVTCATSMFEARAVPYALLRGAGVAACLVGARKRCGAALVATIPSSSVPAPQCSSRHSTRL